MVRKYAPVEVVEAITSSSSSSEKLVCYCMCNNTVMRYNKLHIVFFKDNGIKLCGYMYNTKN